MRRERNRHFGIIAACACAAMALTPTPRAVAQVDHGEIQVFSSEQGGGTIVADFAFDRPVAVEESVCVGGVCLYAATSPGLVAPDDDPPPASLFSLDDGILFTFELVALSPQASFRSGSTILDAPGQIVRLGLSPFHFDPVWQVELPEGVVGEYFVTFKITSSAPFYLDSADYTVLLTNGPIATTTSSTLTTSTTATTSSTLTTTTLDGAPICGDGLVTTGEDCDDGDTEWSTGQHCRTDCTRVACANPDDTMGVTATDALVTLRAAVAVGACDLCVCDVDSSGKLSAGDALRLLRVATGAAGEELACPPCG